MNPTVSGIEMRNHNVTLIPLIPVDRPGAARGGTWTTSIVTWQKTFPRAVIRESASLVREPDRVAGAACRTGGGCHRRGPGSRRQAVANQRVTRSIRSGRMIDGPTEVTAHAVDGEP
ncbi:hypothetical protein MILUP08_45484 [Micromonospora lupini str. Lupac 08]|uniref:Uncharacterized protein n=1 Tax=Micromonospora lupini str. Lupac 08 TaxID=1150864 RepID=I0L9V4_9ACTN|nr:hypothetical protein MILUP08_45484 [Micromonospora lupini str. Lupac 08]